MYRLYTEFVEATSLHGLKYANFRSSKCTRVFWIVLVIALVCLSFYLAGAVWLRFIGNPIRFSIVSQHTPVGKIPFPAVTICTANRLKKTNIDAFMKSIIYLPENVTKEKVREILPALTAINGILGNLNLNDLEPLEILNEVFEMNRYEPEEVLNLMTQSCDDFIEKCQWEGRLIDCKEIFHVSYSIFGRCCSFNYVGSSPFPNKHIKPINSSYFGASLGLSIALNTMDWDVEEFEEISTSQLSVHGNNEYPLMTTNPVILRQGYETFVSVKCIKVDSSRDVEELDLESRKCALPGDIKLRNFREYGEINCEIDCLLAILRKKCGCTIYMFPKRLHDPVCRIPDVLCTVREMAYILQSYQSCECPGLCSVIPCQVDSNSIELSREVSSPNPFYSQFNMNSSYAVVHVFYPSQVIRVQRQDLIASWIYVLYNLGGVFGLCLGCSLISVIEVCYYLYRWVKQKICNIKNRNTHQINFCN